MLCRKTISITIFAWLAVTIPAESFAADKILCLNKKTEKITAKVACAKREVPLKKRGEAKKIIEDKPRVGPAGPQGPSGNPGTEGPAGPKGSPGFQGDKGNGGGTGSVGPIGAPGDSITDPLKPGTGGFGLVGGDYDTGANNGTACTTFTFPFLAPSAPTDAIVKRVMNGVIGYCGTITCCGENPSGSCCGTEANYTPLNCYSNNENTPQIQGLCTGTADSPTAAPGVVCFYPKLTWNAKNIQASPLANGFKVCWDFDGEYVNIDEDTFVKGVWAYTAPL